MCGTCGCAGEPGPLSGPDPIAPRAADLRPPRPQALPLPTGLAPQGQPAAALSHASAPAQASAARSPAPARAAGRLTVALLQHPPDRSGGRDIASATDIPGATDIASAATTDTGSAASPSPAPGACGPAGPQRLSLELRLLAHNDLQAIANRNRFRQAGVRVVNLLSSPGSGKTSLLEALARLGIPGGAMPSTPQADERSPRATTGPRQAVIVGDLATDNDARRLQAAGLPALQISTGMGCHLEAGQVASALDRLESGGQPLTELDLLWIENVGNLICPAAFDLGETLRLVLLAAGEGEDKPLKYPSLFQTADLVVISKMDLAAAVGFRRQEALRAIRRVAPRARILDVSARSGEGLAGLMALLLDPALPAADHGTHQPAPSGRIG